MNPGCQEPAQPALLAASGLQKSFGLVPALRGAGLELARGEMVAVVGRSGSGKTTLLRCLAGLMAPDAGTVTFDGADICALNDKERRALLRSRFGFVFQSGQLIPELTALDNVALPLLLQRVGRRAALSRARAQLALFGLEAIAGRRPSQVSGGQAQRVAIARALVTNPDIVFADEPTGALDSESAAQVLGELRRRCIAAGCGVLLVTHDPAIAVRADRAVTVVDGRTAPEPQ